jgi:type IV secretory pathway VirD2 relaxase
MASRAPLEPAAQLILSYLMDRIEMLHAELMIAKKEKEEMRVVLGRWKNKNKGKRLVIKNTFILLTHDIPDGVQQEEDRTIAQ